MSKKIKDRKWILDTIQNNKNRRWDAHDVSSSGNAVLLRESEDGDIGSCFKLIMLKSNGISDITELSSILKNNSVRWKTRPRTSSNFTLSDCQNIKPLFCNFIPDGSLFSISLVGSKIHELNTRWHGWSEFVESIKNGSVRIRLTKIDLQTGPKVTQDIILDQSSELVAKYLQLFEEVTWDVEKQKEILFGRGNYRVWFHRFIRGEFEAFNHVTMSIECKYNREATNWEDERGVGVLEMELKPSNLKITRVREFWRKKPRYVDKIEQLKEIKRPKKYSNNNWGKEPGLEQYAVDEHRLGIDESKSGLALVYGAGRKIMVSTEGRGFIHIALNFGEFPGSPEDIFSRNENNFLCNSKNIYMNFTADNKRLVVLSYLPYSTRFDGKSDNGKVLTVKSYDVAGRYSEIERGKLRREDASGKIKIRKKRIDALTKAGLPFHIAKLIALNEIEDDEGIELFRYLRSGGIPGININDQDPLELIDKFAFSSAITRENAKFLIQNRQHIKLIKSILNGETSLDDAKYLLLDMNFQEYPEAVERVVEGADKETVAKIYGIKMKEINHRKDSDKDENTKLIEGIEGRIFRRKNRF
tara:strand:+ start:2002 stop:3759 length:1758 start_codon:yes stop_codon:yes gene_type:complete